MIYYLPPNCLEILRLHAPCLLITRLYTKCYPPFSTPPFHTIRPPPSVIYYPHVPKLLYQCHHQDDFLLAASIFDNSEFLDQIQAYDILVTYYPLDTKADKRSAFLHKLHFVVTPPKTLEKYYEFRRKSFLGCDPEILFGDFIWIGELNVKINFNPQFE